MSAVAEAISRVRESAQSTLSALFGVGRGPGSPGADRRSEPRWLMHKEVRLFFVQGDETIAETVGNFVEQSDAGARLWTCWPARVGDRFLIVDGEGKEGEACVVWAKPESGGVLIGASVGWKAASASLHLPPREEQRIPVEQETP